MIVKFTAFQRHVNHATLLAGIFATASAFAAPQVATPIFSPAAGVYTSAQSVTITSATPGASIVYTTDGSIPTVSAGTVTHGALYSVAITVSGNTTLSAMAFENGYADSAVAIDGYTLQGPSSSLGGTSPATVYQPAIAQATAPTFSLAPATYPSAQSTTITSPTSGATIIYTTDGSTPTETAGTPTGTGTALSNGGSVSVNATMILKAIAHATGLTDSPVTSNIYTITSWPRAIVNVIHDFDSGTPNPIAGLVQISNGNFYGTVAGSNSTNSAAFELTSANSYIPFVFAPPNGFEPTAPLVLGTDGNFYGTTFAGGSNSDGTIFRSTTTGTLTTVANFTGANGSNPTAALVQASNGNFYGTTTSGGSSQLGTVFSFNPTTNILTTLVTFTGANGAVPAGPLKLATDGNFYGTTFEGGSSASGSNPGDGTVFKMTSAGVLTTLFSFTGPSGANPIAGLIQVSNGLLYGTTSGDGSTTNGTVFDIPPSGGLSNLVIFDGVNGNLPSAGLVQGTDGNFYGVTEQGGSGAGTIFSTSVLGSLTILASFDGANGSDPSGNLIQGSDGNFYGTTNIGGSLNLGTIFQLIVPPGVSTPYAPVFNPAAGTYLGAQTVGMSTAFNGASIVYTTNGSLPSERGGVVTNGTLFSSPISIGATTTVRALAFKSGMLDSTVTSATYTINIPPPAASGGGGGGGAPSYWFLGFLAFAGILRWRLQKAQALT